MKMNWIEVTELLKNWSCNTCGYTWEADDNIEYATCRAYNCNSSNISSS